MVIEGVEVEEYVPVLLCAEIPTSINTYGWIDSLIMPCAMYVTESRENNVKVGKRETVFHISNRVMVISAFDSNSGPCHRKVCSQLPTGKK